MIRDFLFQLKLMFSQTFFHRGKGTDERLKESYGQLKEDAFNLDSIERYFRNKDNTKAYQVLSDKTCNDLDFDDLYTYLDRTNSRVGQQYLYNKLRAINLDKKQTELDEEIIAKLSEDVELRVSIQKELEKLNHKDAYYITTLFQEENPSPPSWFFIVKLLSVAAVASLILSFFNPAFLIVLMGIFCINFILHYWNKNNLIQYVSSIPQLFRLHNVATLLFKNSLLKELDPALSKSFKLIHQVKSRMSFFQLEAKLQGDFEIIAWFLFEIVKTLFLLEPLLLFGVLKRLNTKRNEVEDIFKFVGHIDLLISIASLRAGTDAFCIPNINDESKIIADKISHPLIFNCTPNAIQVSDKSVLLTGSNMSGKTSFIRAIGLNIITGLTINTCFAKSLTFPLLKVYSAIRISDDLMNDKSYYFEEVLTIKEMISESESGEKNLFLLDELFKGTNTIERISAGKAVLSALSKKENIVFVSTHDIELADLLANKYCLYHFSETVSEKTVDFDYKLKEGKLKNRNALRILEMNGYPKEIVGEAMEISKKLDQSYLATK